MTTDYINKMIVTAAVIMFVGVIGLVGAMDYEDEVLQQQHYIEMVCAGHWPDYNDISPECE